MNVTQIRLALLHAGYCPLPASGKAVFLENWRQTKVDDEQISRWESEHPDWGNTGVLLGNVVCIDIDILDQAIADTVQRHVEEIVGSAPRLVRVGQAPKRAIIFQVAAEPFTKLTTGPHVDSKGVEHRVEILCDGQQFIAAGTHPVTNLPYTWLGKPLWEVPRANLPVLTLEQAQDIIVVVRRIMMAAGLQEKYSTGGDNHKYNGAGDNPDKPTTVDRRR